MLGFSNISKMLLLVFIVYGSSFLYLVAFPFAESFSLSVKYCVNRFQDEVWVGLFFVKFLLLRLLREIIPGTNQEAQALGGFGVFYVCVLPSAGKG